MTVARAARGRRGPRAATSARPRRSPRPSTPCRSLQHPEGCWKGELETNVTMDAEDLLLRQFLGHPHRRARPQPRPRWIRSQPARRRHLGQLLRRPARAVDHRRGLRRPPPGRRPGRRPPHARAPPSTSGTPAGSRPPGCSPGSGWPCSGCGPGTSSRSCRPRSCSCPPWCRSTSTTSPAGPARRSSPSPSSAPTGPVRPHRRQHRRAPHRRRGGAGPPTRGSWAARFATARPAAAPLRAPADPAPAPAGAAPGRALDRRAARRPTARWGGIQPPWVYSLMALPLLGYPLDHPVMRAGLAGLDGFTIDDERGRRLEACQSPVWDTALAVIALADAGVDRDDPALRRRRPLAGGRGDHRAGATGRVRRPRPGAGRLGLRVRQRPLPRHRRHGRGGARARPRRAGRTGAPLEPGQSDWVLGMQCARRRVGGLRRRQHPDPVPRAPVLRLRRAHRPAERRRHRPRRRDAGRARPADARPSTAASSGCSAPRRPTARGSAAGAPTTSTGPARPCRPWWPPASRREHPAVRPGRGLAGGAPERRRRMGRGPALLRRPGAGAAAGPRPPPRPPGPCWPCWPRGSAARRPTRGVGYLVDTQRPDGTWDEPWYTGTGFPGDFYINYHLYRMVFPVMALGRYVRRVAHG